MEVVPCLLPQPLALYPAQVVVVGRGVVLVNVILRLVIKVHISPLLWYLIPPVNADVVKNNTSHNDFYGIVQMDPHVDQERESSFDDAWKILRPIYKTVFM